MYATMLSAALRRDPAIEVVGVASGVDEALERAAALRPDVVLLDHLMDGVDSSVLAPRLRRCSPASTILIISGAMDEVLVGAAEAAGADGWIAKASSPGQMRERILAVRSEGGTVLRVALCDDSEMFRALLRQTLTLRGGFEIVGECGDGAACLEDLARTTPDVLVLDLDMPELTGEQVLERIAEVSPGTRVVVVSGEPESEVEPVVRRLGAVDFLSKGDRDLVAVLAERLQRAAVA